jgi:CDP-diacylglycerol--glycerol-3-phosphate 3-phosphatidyltransferase
VTADGAATEGRDGAPRQRTFGPSAIATPANAVTMMRVLVAPVLWMLIVQDIASWPAFTLWAILTATDGFDGYVARRQGTTRSGAFLDPLADKILILGSMVALVAVGRFWWVPVALIAARELAVSVWRIWWGRRGVAVPASFAAKAKTVVQAAAIGFAVAPFVGADPAWPADVMLWAAVALTLVSGAQYMIAGRRATTTMAIEADIPLDDQLGSDES